MSVPVIPITASDPSGARATLTQSPVIRQTVSYQQGWLNRLLCGRRVVGPVSRLRERSTRYYLRCAKAPSARQHRPAKSTLPPRPESIPDLRRCHIDIMLSLSALAVSIVFIVCYCLFPVLRRNLGNFEGLACSVAVAILLAAGLMFLINVATVRKVHRNARRYAEFIMAMVDEKGNFNIKAEDDNDYATYVRAFGLKTLVISQREYYEWFVNGNPPVRQVPAGYVPTATDAE